MTIYNEHKGPKTAAGVRDIPLPRHLATMMKTYIGEFYTENKQKLVFTTFRGTVVPQSDVRLLWYRLLRRVGLFNEADRVGKFRDGKQCRRQFHFHALRHYASSFMIANQIPLMDAANLLGHEHFDLTLKVYAHPVISQSARSSMFEAMAEKFLPLQGPVIDACDTQDTRPSD